jgi:hypothetical protein
MHDDRAGPIGEYGAGLIGEYPLPSPSSASIHESSSVHAWLRLGVGGDKESESEG